MTMQFHRNEFIASWGRVGKRVHDVAHPRFAKDVRDWNAKDAGPRLAVGNRRSYSDVCLADGGRLVDMTGLNRLCSFDPETGMLVAEAGLTIDALLKHFVPLGFFVPVTPGTRFVTLGGAVANDVHGKNHHRAGTFGSHVRSLVLERSGEGSVRLTPRRTPGLFAATVGGLGLTGMITEVELQLQRIPSSQIEVDTLACDTLDELCEGLAAGDAEFEHNVAWIDCTASGSRLGRGLLSRGNWSDEGPLEPHREPKRKMPTDRVGALLNPLTLKLFNLGYHAKGTATAGHGLSHYDPFLYPLDSILHWNRLYGRSGFYQYQCVIPDAAGREPIRELLAAISASGEGSFLAVLKRFGDVPSPGMLSFPMPGLTLALDFSNRGEKTLCLLSRLDAIVEAAGGRLYAAKDQRMPARLFKKGYPQLGRFKKYVDPMCQSEFWKRMTA
jgi:FAD/FMN-containing dehydrogenase